MGTQGTLVLSWTMISTGLKMARPMPRQSFAGSTRPRWKWNC